MNAVDRTNLDALAQAIGRPYLDVLDAALHDTGYLRNVENGHARNLRIGDRVRTPRGDGVRTLEVVKIGQPKDDWGDLLFEFIDAATGETIQHLNARGDDMYGVVQEKSSQRSNRALR